MSYVCKRRPFHLLDCHGSLPSPESPGTLELSRRPRWRDSELLIMLTEAARNAASINRDFLGRARARLQSGHCLARICITHVRVSRVSPHVPRRKKGKRADRRKQRRARITGLNGKTRFFQLNGAISSSDNPLITSALHAEIAHDLDAPSAYRGMHIRCDRAHYRQEFRFTVVIASIREIARCDAETADSGISRRLADPDSAEPEASRRTWSHLSQTRGVCRSFR